jgi:hypothetical protein
MKQFLFLTTVTLLIVLSYKKKRKSRTQLIFTTYFHNFKIKILSMQLQKQEFVNSILGLVDHETQAPIEATFSNIELTSSDTAIFTADSDVDADGTIDIVGVAPGTATLGVKADVKYIDGKTGEEVTASKEATIDVTITEPLIDAETTDLVVSFSAPKPVPVV